MNIFPDICEILDKIAITAKNERKSGIWTNTKWTTEITQKIAELGKSYGYEVAAPSIPNKDYDGWLFDLCWMKYLYTKAGRKVLIEVPLILESEWEKSDRHRPVVADFEKLLVGNSKYKVMIFQANNISDAKKVMDELKQAKKYYIIKQDDSLYLLSCFLQDDSYREFYHIII